MTSGTEGGDPFFVNYQGTQFLTTEFTVPLNQQSIRRGRPLWNLKDPVCILYDTGPSNGEPVGSQIQDPAPVQLCPPEGPTDSNGYLRLDDCVIGAIQFFLCNKVAPSTLTYQHWQLKPTGTNPNEYQVFLSTQQYPGDPYTYTLFQTTNTG